MRLTGYNTASRARFDVQMTPMIDVVFQLLIFFVCTVSFQQQEQSLAATPKAAPTAGGGAAADRPVPPELEDLRQVEVMLARRNEATFWTVNGDGCANLADVEQRLAALARLKQFKKIVPVVLDVADEVPLADAIDVYDLALRLGFEKVQFVTPEEP